jgi:hypothetical protein
LASQHPVGHVAAEQVIDDTHSPDAPHVSFIAWQFTHAWPAVPHASAVLGWQPAESQHPLGHVDGEQAAGGTHMPDGLHASPVAWQFVHAWPPVPQLALAVPRWQAPSPPQHPWQFAGPHTIVPPQTPFLHSSSMVMQFTHAWPLVPHAALALPSTHVLSAPQHPAQLPGPHVAPSAGPSGAKVSFGASTK